MEALKLSAIWPITGLDLGDFDLTRNGADVSLSGATLTAGIVFAESPRHNPQSSLTSLIFSPGPERLLAIGSGWQVSDLPIAVTRTGRLLWDAEPRVPFVGAVSADASMIAVASKTGELTLLAETGKQIREWVLPGRVTALAFSINGRYLAAAHSDGSVGVYRLQ